MIRKILLATGLMLAAPMAFAATCSVDLEGNDAMKFNLSNIDVSKSCKTFTVNLKHTGSLPKTAMGHNWVLSKTPTCPAWPPTAFPPARTPAT